MSYRQIPGGEASHGRRDATCRTRRPASSRAGYECAQRGGGRGFLVVRIVVGLILLVAAALKLDGFRFDPLARDSLLASPRAQVAVIELELFLGLWLLSGLAQRWARYAALAFFGVLAAASLVMALEGRSHCGCFGRIEVNPWWTFGLDGAVLLLLAWFRPAASPPATIFESSLLRMAGIAVIVVGGLSGAMLLAVPSPGAWLAQWRGQAVTVEPSVADLGAGWPGEQRTFAVYLTNRTASPVRIVGGSARCGCTVTRDLPVELAPGETKAIQIEVRFVGSPGRFAHPYQLYTDAADQWAVVARFRGRVLEPPR